MNPYKQVFKVNRYSLLMYNHFNDVISKRIINTLQSHHLIVSTVNFEEYSFFTITAENECHRNEFLNNLRNAYSSVLKEHYVQLIGATFHNTTNFLARTDSKLKPLSLTVRNMNFLNTQIEGDFVARPKSMSDVYEILEHISSNEKMDLSNVEFVQRIDNIPCLVTVERADRLNLIYAQHSTNVLV